MWNHYYELPPHEHIVLFFRAALLAFLVQEARKPLWVCATFSVVVVVVVVVVAAVQFGVRVVFF
jgi:hypothetical protein